jgi:hypothetical protein
MKNRIRFLTIMSWVSVVITLVLVVVAILDGVSGSIGVVASIAAGQTMIVGSGAGIVFGIVLAVILIIVGASVFSGLNDQAALLQTALNIETNGDELVEEVKMLNKYLRQMVPFLKEPPGRP